MGAGGTINPGSGLDVTYNSTKIIDSLEVTPPVTVTYNGETIATLNEGDTKTLQCNGKVMVSDVVIGDKTLQCNGKLMASDVIVEVKGGVTIPELPPESEWVNRTFTINDGETYQISDVGSYVFNAGYRIEAPSNATLILKNASQQDAQVFFDQIFAPYENPLNIVVDTGTAYIQIISPSNYESFWCSNLTFKTGSNVAINDYSVAGSQFYGNIVCEEGSTLHLDLHDVGIITGDITANGRFEMHGGIITGDITANGRFEMHGGTITGDITANGRFEMHGGTITGDITANGNLDIRGGTINTIGTLFKTASDYSGSIDISGGEMHYGDFIFEVDYYPSRLTTRISGGTFYPQNAAPNVPPMVLIGGAEVYAVYFLVGGWAFEYDAENNCWNVVYVELQT